MHSPKFSIGELVRVDSRDHPHRNGIYTVVRIKPGCHYDSVERRWISGFCYKLDDEGAHQWAESALRKIDPPGEDFKRFMDKVLGEPVELVEECPISVAELGQ